MARNKKPSIYSDRANIGSAEELDEYGVWVKGEPQILSADEKTGLTSNLDDFALPTADDSSGDESLSIDDAAFDIDDASGPSKSEKVEFPDDNIELDIDDNPLTSQTDLADLNMPSDDELGTPASAENIDIENASFDEFEVPSALGEDETTETESGGHEENDFTTEELSGEITDSEALNTDELGDDVADGAVAANDEFDVEDLNLPTVKSIENNVNALQDDFDAAQGDGGLSTQLLKKIASELSSIRSELTDLKKEFASIRFQPQEEEKHAEGGGFFSDDDDEAIALTGDELNNILSTGGTLEEGVPETIDDEEDEAIALTGDELDNILNSADFTEESGTEETPESEFSVDDSTPVSVPASDGTDANIEDIDVDIDIPHDGIADASPAVDDLALPEGDTAIEDVPLATDDLSLPEGDTTIEDIPLDDLALPESDTTTEDLSLAADDLADLPEVDTGIKTTLDADDFPVLAEDATEDTPLATDDLADLSGALAIDEEPVKGDELEILREEGAPIPITDTPENSSYLEESGDIDLSDAVIDEPELSADGIKDELTEPSLDSDDFNLDSLDDLSIDSDLDLDSDLSAGDTESTDEEVAQPAQEIPEESALDTEGVDKAVDNVISESNFENELEEPVVFDDFQDFTADNFDSVIEPEPPAKAEPVKQPVAKAPAAPPPVQQQATVAPQPAPQAAPIIMQAPTAQQPAAQPGGKDQFSIPSGLRSELRNILSYMDQLLESLPEEKIEEFAKSEYFDSYKKLFKDLGLV